MNVARGTMSKKVVKPMSTVTFEGKAWHTVTEQSATMLYEDPKQVFYNPVQETNRDLSIAVLKTHAALHRKGNRPMRVLEALAATGLRSVRYAKEVDAIGECVANDLDEHAVEAITRNARYNGVEESVKAVQGDAVSLLYNSRTLERKDQFDAIDLDPYGTAAPFIDGAVQAIRNRGLLLVTCTDMATLAGSNPESCFAKYGGVPIRGGRYGHELALRIVLANIARSAARYGRSVEPLLCLSIDFYIRLFLRVHDSPAITKRLMADHGLVYQCVQCPTFAVQPLGRVRSTKGEAAPDDYEAQKRLEVVCRPARGPPMGMTCDDCDGQLAVGGPMWIGPLHSQTFARAVVAELKQGSYGTAQKSIALASQAAEELPDTPFSYDLGVLASTLRLSVPPLNQFLSALVARGHRVSMVHTGAGSFKTDAPTAVLWDILRSWKAAREADKIVPSDTPGGRILSKPATQTDDFSVRREVKDMRAKRARKPDNAPYSGPMSRAGTSKGAESLQEKSAKNQNKRQRAEGKSD